MNIVTNAKKKKKILLEIATALSCSKATGRDWEALCAGLSWPHHPDMGSSLMWQLLGVPVTTCHHFKPESGSSSYFSNKLAYFTIY